MWILFVGNPDVTIPTITIENGFETQSENGFIEINQATI
jgi:exonuclease SbcD